jgi:FkbM family methyltransferase
MNGPLRKIRRLLRREDLRRHPLKGIIRRIAWRLRWSISKKPWLVRAHGSLPLFVPHGGAAALIYYQGASEPEIADFIREFLKPGMVFVDVGAHLGEYTLLAATILRDSGYVHAFEPRPDTFEILLRNARLNRCGNIAANSNAVWHDNGSCQFERTPDPSVSVLRPRGNSADGGSLISVNAITLDHYFADSQLIKPTLIKVDVEGAELYVFRGARSLLSLPPPKAPVLIFEYGTANTDAFGYSAGEICELLREFGYTIYHWSRGGLVCLESLPALPEMSLTCNLVAAKAPSLVSTKLEESR